MYNLSPRRRKIAVIGGALAAIAGGMTAFSRAQAPEAPPSPPPPPAVAPGPNPAAAAATALMGKTAPEFTLPDQNDKSHSLSESRGKWVVLAFYPADMSSGCTFQNISYTRTSDKFAALNAVVYTVSTQDTASKKAFCAKDSLTHTLLADVGGKAAQSYGVLNGKVARRYTFYIRPDGTVAYVDTKINTRQAGEDSLTRLAKLTGPQGSGDASGPSNLLQDDGPVGASSAAPASRVVALGAPLPNFSVTNVSTGGQADLASIAAGKKATVLVFISTHCPVSNAYNDRMEQIAATYGNEGVAFAGLNANATETIADAADHAKQKGFTFPVFKDDGNKVADQFRAQVTPEVFVADAHGVLVYHGPIDDSQDATAVQKPYLKTALDAILAGKAVPAADRRAFGCSIKRLGE